ncbi:SNF2 family N-terminal domain-containing protein [Hygrophoropsis aurantiaca]|uniref:SNF2 family N-terminal domain-containing protein n=1 Tax=Hygrophoropsis aurantiaca TaxID=72124 RepID=A0ACB8AGH8_9AGAM|nr:SNF2 family N-terminal domain-containing protein [Hygrophoropsis aurantiaca]
MADFVYNSIDNLSEGRSVQAAMESLKLRSHKDLLPGLEVRLLPHQLIGVSWMVDQELKSPHKGGILADDMGLGKTVQMIATMAVNLPKGKISSRTCLIVVPAALLQQWKEEIETKTNDLFTVHIHHGRDKLSSIADIKSKDIIITTYHTLIADCTVPSDIEEFEALEWLSENGGLLARMKWYRVVLDEAQYIRNRGTASSRSVAVLNATYRWMLTGTPVTNTLADIYGLIRFGRFRPWNDWKDFNEYIAKMQQEDPPLAALRAQEILKPLLLRRTKISKLEGKPILQLPPKDIELMKLEFSKDERELYDTFEKRSHIRINRFLKSRTLLKNHHAVLVMILRLRQLCCHPNLILSHAADYADPTLLMSDDNDKELGRAIKIMGVAWVDAARFMKRALANDMLVFSDEAEEPEATCPVCKDLFMNGSGRVLACGHEICFDCLLESSNAPIAHNGEFGYGTEQENIRAEKEYEQAAAKGFRPCPTCKKMNDLTPAKVFKSAAFEPEDDQVEKAAREIKRKRRAADKKPLKPAAGKSKTRRVAYESESESESKTDTDVEMDSPAASPSPKKRFRGATPEAAESSDDDLPDFSQLFANGGKLKEKKIKPKPRKLRSKKAVQDDDVLDLTLEDISGPIPLDGSDMEVSGASRVPSGSSIKPPKKDKGKRRAQSSESDTEDDEPRSQSQKSAGEKEPEAPSDELVAMWKKGDYDLEPSTKMMALMRLLKEWDSTGDKTICYSQWTSMLDLVEIMFSRCGLRNLRYDGQMDRTAKDTALSMFKSYDGPKIILISTKCGGVGLNLVSANRVINLDVSWNYASESQAYDRVHRLGQEKDVFVKRLIVKDTIEERMLRLQEVKTDLADAALGEGSGVKLHKMSVKEIKLLFGMTKADEAPAAPK